MAMALILHRVADYPAWRQVYDSVADFQAAGGVTRQSVHQMAGDPNNVLVIHEFASMAQAQSFVANPELREVMARAGVAGQPRIEFFE